MAEQNEALIGRRERRIALALLVGGLAPIFDTTIVAVALRTLATEFGVSLATIQWVSTGYLLALGITIPIVAWAELRFGSKRVWMAALALFLIGSIACACAWNAESLIAFRFLQGAGSGLAMPLMQSIFMRNAPAGGQFGRAMAVISLPMALGPILGPAIGGLVLNSLSWRWLFLINVPLCVCALVLAVFLVPGGRPGRPRPFDAIGFVLLAPGLFLLLLGLANTHEDGGFSRLDVWLPIGAGALLVACFTWHALRAGERALVAIRVLSSPSSRIATAMLFLTGAALFGAMFLLPLYYQELRGQDVLAAGLLMIPQGIGTLLSRSLAGRLTDSLGPRAVAAGAFLITAVATVPFALAGPDTPMPLLLCALVLRGIGIGGVFIPTMAAAYIGLDRSAIADTSILTRVAQQLGGSFGTAVLAVVLESAIAGSASGSTTMVAAFHLAFWFAVGFAVVACGFSLLLPSHRRQAA